jgi:hypothetical protein
MCLIPRNEFELSSPYILAITLLIWFFSLDFVISYSLISMQNFNPFIPHSSLFALQIRQLECLWRTYFILVVQILLQKSTTRSMPMLEFVELRNGGNLYLNLVSLLCIFLNLRNLLCPYARLSLWEMEETFSKVS